MRAPDPAPTAVSPPPVPVARINCALMTRAYRPPNAIRARITTCSALARYTAARMRTTTVTRERALLSPRCSFAGPLCTPPAESAWKVLMPSARVIGIYTHILLLLFFNPEIGF